MNRLLLALGLITSLNTYAHEAKPPEFFEGETQVGALMAEACETALSGEILEAARKQWKGKTVVLDTNVLLNDPYAFFKFPGATVVIPGTALEEIDNNKSKETVAKAAREFARQMDTLVRKGNPYKGIDLGEGTTLRIDNRDETRLLMGKTLDRSKKDNEIIALALSYTMSEAYGNVVLVSDDINVRVKAASEEIFATPFEYEWVRPAEEIERDYQVVQITKAELDKFLETGSAPIPKDIKIRPNEFVLYRTENMEGGIETLARYVYDRENPEQSSMRALRRITGDIQPKNLEQAMYLDLLLDPTIHLVISEADAGTGKTFLALFALVNQLPDGKQPEYANGMMSRSLVHMGKMELGALPGDKDAKLHEYFNSYYDNLRQLKSSTAVSAPKPSILGNPEQAAKYLTKHPGEAEKYATDVPDPKIAPAGETTEQKVARLKKLSSTGSKPVKIANLELLAFPYIRGRTLSYTYTVVDEFQNTTIHEAKTMLTRIGEGSKIVLLGNAKQIDLPYLNERNNGLSVTASLFTQDSLTDAERSLVGFVHLREGVRSELATLSNKLFEQGLPQQ